MWGVFTVLARVREKTSETCPHSRRVTGVEKKVREEPQ